MLEYIFWISLFVIAYTYLGYPLALQALSLAKRRIVRKRFIYPHISVVIAALDEENSIRWRLENLINQDYPKSRIELIVVSDGSSDKTSEVVEEAIREYKDREIKLYSFAERRGKAEALNYGVSMAKGDIVVFTDARQTFEPDAVKHLVGNFNDPSVGCVSGELIFTMGIGSMIRVEMGMYWIYEKWIRRKESQSGSTMGATGAIYAIRRHLYKPLFPGTLIDDVVIPMNVVMQGQRVVFDSSAVAYDVPSRDISQEWMRKVRTLAGNWQLLSLSPDLVNPRKNPCWWRLFSHKLLRLAVPFLLLALLVSGALLSAPLYQAATLIQLILYAVVILGFIAPPLRKIRFINVPYFFILLNLAVVVGLLRWCSGKCGSIWTTSDKASNEKNAL